MSARSELSQDGLDVETRRKYHAWLKAQGISQAPKPPPWRAEREELARLEAKIEWTERTKHHAPDPISARRVEAKLERLEQAAQELRQQLPEWAPVTWEEAAAPRGPICRVPSCDEPLSREEAFYVGLCPRCVASQPHLQQKGDSR